MTEWLRQNGYKKAKAQVASLMQNPAATLDYRLRAALVLYDYVLKLEAGAGIPQSCPQCQTTECLEAVECTDECNHKQENGWRISCSRWPNDKVNGWACDYWGPVSDTCEGAWKKHTKENK